MARVEMLAALAAITLAVSPASAGEKALQEDSTGREIGRTTEKELKVTLTSSFGSVLISRGKPEKILVLEPVPPGKDESKVGIDYSIRNRIGFMDLSLGEGSRDNEKRRSSFKFANLSGGKWFLQFSDAVPISFDVQLGVGKGDFDLSGLQVKDFNLSTGASDVSLSFNQPNKSCIESMSIESGVSKFSGRNLCNANFKRFRFQGGVGAYTLDFAGSLSSEVDVDIEVGLGVMTVYLPPDVGAKVIYEKSWASRLDCPDDFTSTSETEYTSGNYYSAVGKMNIRVDSGLGSIRIRRH
ncbi:MAG TPA: hypothetical protein VL126_07755 [Bacteroidota bacterium]|nr:hypothetical protein [Bacteroidota bacterium]